MEGPTSSWRSRNRITRLTLQEHDDDDVYFTGSETFFIASFLFILSLRYLIIRRQQIEETKMTLLKFWKQITDFQENFYETRFSGGNSKAQLCSSKKQHEADADHAKLLGWTTLRKCLYNILYTVNTQHTSRQDALIIIRLYLATCFGLKQPSSGQLRTILRCSKKSNQWDPNSFTLKFKF